MKTMSALLAFGIVSCASAQASEEPAPNDDARPLLPFSASVEVSPFGVVLPAPTREARLAVYLYREADVLSDAYADRNEDAFARERRLRTFAGGIATALCTDWRGPMLRERGEDWKYGATLVWIAHRETRIARNPRQLGDEDQGRAHGPWQVWTWRGMNPYAPETALDMLIDAPGAWSLPRHEPWNGYPECARWIARHPFESFE